MKDVDKERIVVMAPAALGFFGSAGICLIDTTKKTNINTKASMIVVGGSMGLAAGFCLLVLIRWASAEARQQSSDALRENLCLKAIAQADKKLLAVEADRIKKLEKENEEQKEKINDLTRTNSKLGAQLRSKEHDSSLTNPAALFRRVA